MNQLIWKIFQTLILLFVLQSQVQASTGNLRGVCYDFVTMLFPNSELIGIIGGNMLSYDVIGFLIDTDDQVAYRFDCIFHASHRSKPDAMTLVKLAIEGDDLVNKTLDIYDQFNEAWEAEYNPHGRY